MCQLIGTYCSETGRGRRGYSFPTWLTWAGASMLGASVMAVVVLLLVLPAHPEEPRTPWLATPEEVAQFTLDAGVADEALASVHNVPSAGVPLNVMAMPMPKNPLPGQRRPPCDPDSELVSGYEIEGRCVIATIPEPRQPTSDPP